MSYHADIFDALSGETAAGPRVYADVADGSTTVPYLVFQTITTGGETNHDGKRGVEFPTVQVTAWAVGRIAAAALADQVNEILEGNTIGDSQISFQFSDRRGNYDAETRLSGEILEYRASVQIPT